MISHLFSAAIVGVDAVEVIVEIDVQPGAKMTYVVGLPDTAVKESTQRVNAAIINSGFASWEGITVVNLAPADLKKQGPSFDLPIALGVIAASEAISLNAESWFVIGELALDGTVRPVKGMLSLALEARAHHRTRLIVPRQNAQEALVVSGIEIFPVDSLRQAWELLKEDHKNLQGKRKEQQEKPSDSLSSTLYSVDFDEIKGQPFTRRAMEVAAAGGHNILLCGSPGSGKSMFAQRLPTILPELTESESIETSKIHSVCGLLKKGDGIRHERPFRAPHHTISDVGLMGGGTNITPGEISLAHNGVLFLDEFPEFKRQTLETLRQPLESGYIIISRASGTLTFPSRFMLMAAMNPCPCGYLGDPKHPCTCTHQQIKNYRRRISGPLLDRFDLLIEVPPVEITSLMNTAGGESSADIRQRVKEARSIQKERYQIREKLQEINCNAHLQGKLMKKYCLLNKSCQEMMHLALEQMNLSARGHDRILKVARTIADLDASEHIATEHLCEAIQLRQFALALQ